MTRQTLWGALLAALLLTVGINSSSVGEHSVGLAEIATESCTISADIPTRDFLGERTIRVALAPSLHQSVASSSGRSSSLLRSRFAGGLSLTHPANNPSCITSGCIHSSGTLHQEALHNGRTVDYYIYSLRHIII